MFTEFDPAVTVLCLVTVYIGATVQASVGIGLGMLSSPVLAIVDPAFVPVAIVVAVIPLSGLVAWSHRDHIDRDGARLMLAGRLPGVIVGVLVLAVLSERLLGVLVAVSVLAAVAVSVTGKKYRVGKAGLIAVGAAAGLMATTSGVGGPPVAIAYQHDTPATMRATISMFFSIGAVMTLIGLAVGGQVDRHALDLSVLLLPVVLLGVATARLFHRRLHHGIVRPFVLGLCTANAFFLLTVSFV